MDDLVDRLQGKYAIGPHLPNGMPEFGFRQFEAPPIQHEAAAEITRLRARVAELTEDRVKSVLPLGPQIDTAVARAEAAEARVTELTVALATARADAYEQAAQVVDARKSIIEVGTELSSRIRALKDAKP
jgi:hypothetical protein